MRRSRDEGEGDDLLIPDKLARSLRGHILKSCPSLAIHRVMKPGGRLKWLPPSNPSHLARGKGWRRNFLSCCASENRNTSSLSGVHKHSIQAFDVPRIFRPRLGTLSTVASLMGNEDKQNLLVRFKIRPLVFILMATRKLGKWEFFLVVLLLSQNE